MTFSLEIHFFCRAISSKQPIFKPCLFSIVFTNIDASTKLSFVPKSNQQNPLPKICAFNCLLFK